MERRRNFHSLGQPDIIIIPMIDIMLFLLIFFMVSTIYMVQVNTLSINLPAAEAAQTETKPTVVSVTVNKKGNIFYDKETQPTMDVSAKVKNTLASNPESIFVIRGDRDTNYADITHALDSLKAAGAKHVSLATESKTR